MNQRVLLAHSLGWPNVARLAISFRRAGFSVDVLAPRLHPVHAMSAPERTFVRRPRESEASLRQAIEASKPQLIVPCDDCVVADLHALHGALSKGADRSESNWIAALIETSLGPSNSLALLASRRRLGAFSDSADVHMPRTDPIESWAELRDWARKHGTPAVLKLDGSWGGRDVVYFGDTASLASAYFKIQLRRSRCRRLRRSLLAGEVPSARELLRPAPGVSVQSFVSGRLANCAVACWRGEVLTSVAAEVVQGHRKFGIATVVRLVDGAAMVAAARSIARRLQLSGMYGFDFVIDEKDGLSKLIEINPRETQINHLALDGGIGLPWLCAKRSAAQARRRRPRLRPAGRSPCFQRNGAAIPKVRS